MRRQRQEKLHRSEPHSEPPPWLPGERESQRDSPRAHEDTRHKSQVEISRLCVSEKRWKGESKQKKKKKKRRCTTRRMEDVQSCRSAALKDSTWWSANRMNQMWDGGIKYLYSSHSACRGEKQQCSLPAERQNCTQTNEMTEGGRRNVTLITVSSGGGVEVGWWCGGAGGVGGACHETIFYAAQRRLACVMHGSVGEIFNLGACLSAVRGGGQRRQRRRCAAAESGSKFTASFKTAARR